MYFSSKKFMVALALSHLICIASLNASDSSQKDEMPNEIKGLVMPGAQEFWLTYWNIPGKNGALDIDFDTFVTIFYKQLGVELDQKYHRQFVKHLNCEAWTEGPVVKPPKRMEWESSLQYHFLSHVFHNLASAHENKLSINQFKYLLGIFGDIVPGDTQWLIRFEEFMMENLECLCGRVSKSHIKSGSAVGSFYVRYSSEIGYLTVCIYDGKDECFFRIRKGADEKWSLLSRSGAVLYTTNTLKSLMLDWRSGKIDVKNLPKLTDPAPPEWFLNYKNLYYHYNAPH